MGEAERVADGAGAHAAEEVLAGSNFNRVVRTGETVRRDRPGAWTPAVHAFLAHLERAGFEGAPRPVGLDEEGREVLTFVPGEVVRDGLPDAGDGRGWDALLRNAGRLLRRFHDASVGFEAPREAVWQDSWFRGALAESVAERVAPVVAERVVCHNDAGPHNTIARGGMPVAFIDWDFAHPAPRAWDVAYGMACWGMGFFAELPAIHDSFAPGERGRRMRVFCEGYGLGGPADRRGLLDIVPLQVRSLFETLKVRAEAGDPFCVRAWEATNGGRPLLEDLAYLEEHGTEIRVGFGAD